MASKSKLTRPPQWWKHLRNVAGRIFWKRERKNWKKEIRNG